MEKFNKVEILMKWRLFFKILALLIFLNIGNLIKYDFIRHSALIFEGVVFFDWRPEQVNDVN